MKCTFLLGSNAFIVNNPVITYVQDNNTVEILRIKSLYSPLHNDQNSTVLIVDTNFTDAHGHNIALIDSDFSHSDYKTVRTDKQIHVTDSNGHIIIDVLQLDEDAKPGLSSHVVNELAHHPDTTVIRLRGDFMFGNHRLTIDNEKFFIDDDVYAESVHSGNNGLELSANGIKV